jgi:hypothetical protein
MKVYNINWVDEDDNYNDGTALFATRELALSYLKDTLEPEDSGNVYSVGELVVVTKL